MGRRATKKKREEAVVSEFMVEYAAALDAGTDELMEESAEEEFPPELDRRCRALLQQSTEDSLKEVKVENFERLVNRAENLAGGLRIVSYLFIAGIILFAALAAVFTQYCTLLIIMSILCGVVFIILKRCEFYFRSESQVLAAISLDRMIEEMSKVDEDLAKGKEHAGQEA